MADNQTEQKNPAQTPADNIRINPRFSSGAEMDLDSIESVPVEVTVVLGETTISVDELLKMGKGAIIELDKKVGEPVELYVNERCVARGEIVIVDNKIGITMTEIIKNDKE